MNTKITYLAEEYGIERQSLYDRLSALGIKPVQRGVLSPEQVEIMNQLDAHLKHGGTIDKFLIQQEAIRQQESALAIKETEQLDTIDRIVAEVAKLLPQKSPIEPYQQLEEVAQHQWAIPTSLVKELIGITPKASNFRRGSFEFHKTAKIGREAGWLVKKIENLEGQATILH